MLLKELFSSDKINQLQETIKKRKKTSLSDFNKQEVDIISGDILTIVKKYPDVKKIWITGSYVYGGHILPNEDNSYIQLKKHFRLKTGASDRDYRTYPAIIDKIDGIDIIEITKNEELLVFDNGFNLFEKK